MFEINYKDTTRATSITFGIFTPFSVVSIVDF